MQERAEVVTVKTQVVNEAVILRFHTSITKELLTNWDVWKRLMTDWDAWKVNKPDVAYLIDNGMGYKGPCPVHGYIHVQQFPVGQKPMRCYEAMTKE